MKYIKLLIVVLLLSSCKRDGIFQDIKDETPFEFHVQVFSDNNRTQKLEGVTVKLYKAAKTEQALPANLIYTKTTDVSGKAIFTKAELASKGWELPHDYDDPSGKGKGIYVVSIEKAGYNANMVKTEPTLYLLLNDGHTHKFMTLLPN